VLGREHGPGPFRDDPYLSPRHVSFHLDGARLQVRDLDSLNGVFYRIAESTELRHLDFIRIGRQLLRFEVLDQLEPLPPGRGGDARALGAPRGEAWGRLVRVSSPGRSSQAFVLAGPEEVIGRERGTILLRDDGFVSGRHARLTTSGTRFFIEDLRSSNGTFVRVRSSRLVASGDLLLLGQQPLRVLLE
jgi:pSer/pThr/pTyr-binding forkhead associated (FHA) protein